MRFSYDDAAPGLTEAFRTLVAGGGGYARGQADQLRYESAIARALADVEQSQAAAAANQALAEQRDADTAIVRQRQQIVPGRMGAQVRQMPGGAGITQQQIGAAIQSALTGGQPGPWATGPAQALDRGLVENLPLLGMEDWKANDIAQAGGQYQKQNMIDDARRDPAGAGEAIRKAMMAIEGKNRYDFNPYGTGDQFSGQLDESPQVADLYRKEQRSQVTENLAQAGRASAGAKNDKFKIEATEDGWVRIPVAGDAGPVTLPGNPKPRARRDAEQADARSAYKADYEFPGDADPSLDEYTAMRANGHNPRVDFKRVLKEAQDAVKKGADRKAVAARLKDEYGINPARLK